MIVKVIGNRETEAFKAAVEVIKKLGHAVWDSSYYYCDVAVAPLLTQKLSQEEIHDPVYGVLVFHPSPLPYGRGASSIRWAYRRKEPVTAAAWFWATDRMDAGDICEMEILKIDYGKSPKEFYTADMLPALKRTLERALLSMAAGYVRKVPQIESYATFDLRLE